MKLLTRSLLASLALVALLHGCARQPLHSGAPNGHFDGLHFSNSLAADKSLLDIVGFISTFPFRREAWPTEVSNGAYPAPPAAARGIVATFINHSTVLLSIDGVNVLTDPIWSERASPLPFAGPRRVRKAGLDFAQLPPIDVILISHDHYDHLDVASLKTLQAHGRDGPPMVVAGIGNGALFERHGITNFVLLDWWESVRHADIEFTFAEVRHRSGRGVADQMKTLWGGYVIRAAAGQVYFAGDTGYGPHFQQTRERYGAFDLSLIPIAAYRPRSFMAPVHLDPQHAVRAHQDLGSRQSIAVHHGTFQLTYEGIEEPYRELDDALAAANISTAAFRVLGFGESLTVPAPHIARRVQ